MTSSRLDRASVAVIGVAHDSSHVLPGWVDALERLDVRDRVELCIVDSGSSEADLARARVQEARVDRFVALPNVGFGSACNAGAAATDAPVLLFTNPDAYIDSLPARALAGTGLGRTLIGGFAVDSPSPRPLGFRNPPAARNQALDLTLGSRSKAFSRSAQRPAWVSGAALMIDRTDFDQLGGFSDELFLYFEDADLCARHIAAGGSVALDRGLRIRHMRGSSTQPSRAAALAPALDGVNRLSGRIYAARHGRTWHRAALYLLVACIYLPRRMALDLVRGRKTLRDSFQHAWLVLRPHRALKRLGADGSKSRWD